MDFIMGLPRTRRQHDFIKVIVDRVAKFAHFLDVKTIDSVEDYKGLGTQANLSTTFPPRTNGQVERTIQTLENS
ncbi:hypothetical protein MTR67_051280 [Solanum verrucosum]|uniref:Integrase catalytic domain-containing protein n=1 Tax=Solanum verrucosum TaxID=315347 RepID=A0AAF0V3L5_SOLVR|nr:hypothetical protein MTR67_051280 [Solanum verrucosum]